VGIQSNLFWVPVSDAEKKVLQLCRKNEDFVASVLEKITGFLYCDTLGDGAADCVAFVDKYGTAAMPVLGDGLAAESATVCDNLGCE
jgi:hypothetical protein